MSEWIVYSKDGLTERCRLKRLEYNGSFMNERTISATFEYHSEVAFDVFDYIVYRNEKFELESIPSVKKISNHNYEYELRFVSLKYELERCEMRDIVPKDNGVTYPTPLTFSFTGDVRYLTERIQANLDSLYGEGVWSIVIPEGVKSEEKNITISQQNCWNALSLVNTTYNLTFSIKGRVITVGGEQSLVEHVFQYGKGKGLYEIERVSDTDTGIVTKVRAYGGTRNLDYSYPKRPEWTDSVLPVSFALSPLRLMLPSFKLDGKTDYVLADDSIINEYGIREASVVYDDIYPSITGMRNSDDEPIDEIKSVDEVDDSKDTFVVYLYDLGFDLESNLTTENAQISMKSGSLIGYTFNISEIEKQEDNSYKITLGRITNEQGDTGNFNIPNSQWSIAAGDKFVLLNILMPQEYIRNAEERLLERAQEYLNEYGRTNFSYNVGLHDKFLKENANIYEELIEGSKLRIYDQNLGISEDVTIQSITITENMGDNVLTQVKVTLNNKPSASTIERIQGQIKELSETSAGQFSTQSELLKQYRRKLDKPFFDRLFAAVDINGNEIPSTDLSTPIAYIKARYSVASIGGFTMYLNDNSYNLPSIYDGLPIDNNTLYWEDVDGYRVLKAKGGGGIAESVSWADITGKPEWLLDGKISYSEIEGTPDLSVYALKRSLSAYVTKTELTNLDYADKDWVKEYVVDINTGNITAITKQMVIDALGYTPYDNANPNGYVTSESIPSLDGYATEDWVIKKGYLTSIPSEYITESELTAKGYATALSVNTALGDKVDKVDGKGLSTEDFTTALKTKLEGLNNYNDTAISNAVTKLRNDFDALVDGDTSTAIDNFNEIIAFLNGVQDNQDLSSIIASIEQQIAAKYTKPSGGIPKSDLVQAVQTSLGKADSALQSHQSIYTLTFQSGTFASGSFTANSGNKTINIPTTTSHVSEGNNLYFTNARAVSALGDTLKSYVTLSGSQTVSGEKNFTGGLKVNGSPIVYDAAKKYWKLEGDLLITGGLTMYGSDSSFTPSTIMDAIAVDGTTISKDGGVLRVIGGGSGSISEITKQMVIDALGFTPISSSDVPTALPNPHSLKFGSKLYDGSASKTILASDLGITWDDILGRPTLLSSFTDDVVAGKYLPLSGGTMSGHLTLGLNSRIKMNAGMIEFNKADGSFGAFLGQITDANNLTIYDGRLWNEIIHTGNYSSYALPLSGGTITIDSIYSLSVKRNGTGGSFVAYENNNGNLGFLGVGDDGVPKFAASDGVGKKIWHEGNFTPADYLPLSGGTLNIDGSFTFRASKAFESSGYGWARNFLNFASQDGNSVFSRIGVYGDQGEYYYMYIGSRDYNGLNLRIYSDKVKWGNNDIFHTGNYSSYALPLSGGVINGTLSISGAVDINGILDIGAYIKFTRLADGKTYLFGQPYGVNDPALAFYDGGSWRRIIHSGNIGSYALPLSGGTISGDVVWKAGTGHRTSLPGHIYRQLFDDNGNVYDHYCTGSVGFNTFANLRVWSNDNGGYKSLRFGGDGTFTWDGKTIIHSGNIGSQSVNYATSAASAKCLTSQQATTDDFGSYLSTYGAQGLSVIVNTSGAAVGNIGVMDSVLNIGSSTSRLGRFLFQRHEYSEALYWQSANGTGTGWGAKRTLAFTDSNVASATKLKTARTIWGQSFDGSADVNGILTINSGGYIMAKDGNGYARDILELSSTNTFYLGYGSAGAGGDTYLHGNNTIFRCGTSRTECMRITSSGNVGIGTTSPSAKLDVHGQIAINGLPTVYSNGVNSFYAGNKAVTSYLGGNNVHLRYGTSETTGLILNSEGNVGIGTTEPLTKLHISGTSGDGLPLLMAESTSNVLWNYAASFLASNITANNHNVLALGQSHSTYNCGLLYYTHSGNSYTSNRISIGLYGCNDIINVVATKRVGINNTEPNYPLDVNNTSRSQTIVARLNNSEYHAGLNLDAASGYNPFIIFTQASSGVGEIGYSNQFGSLYFGKSGTDVGYLNIKISNGNIGIGTTSPSQKLHVDGNILTTGGITMYSQRSLKNVVDERGLSLDELSNIKPTRYTWKDGRDNRTHFGGIADDIQQVLPEVVYNANGVLTMDYGNAGFAIASSLIKPMIEHESEIVSLKRRVRELEEEVKRLRA